MKTIIPPPLSAGDRVEVIAPSGVVAKGKADRGIQFLEAWGLTVFTGDHLFAKNGMFAGSDAERIHDLNKAFNDNDVKAIFCARGGYGLSRIIDRIDLSGLSKAPKWVIGYSDITVLHLWLNQNLGLATIHGEMVSNYNINSRSPETLDSLRHLLFGENYRYRWKGDALNPGRVEAELAGGNLSLITNLTGTGIREWLKGKILFIEDTGDYLYRIDRMMMNLRLSGVLEGLAGLVVGKFSGLEDTVIPFGETIKQIVSDAVKEYNYPVVFDFPAGHIYQNMALCMGAVNILDSTGDYFTLGLKS